jgi:hypothetical protein
MSNPVERHPSLILLISAGYPMAMGMILFGVWGSFWSLGVRAPLSPTVRADQHPGEVSDELGADW